MTRFEGTRLRSVFQRPPATRLDPSPSGSVPQGPQADPFDPIVHTAQRLVPIDESAFGRLGNTVRPLQMDQAIATLVSDHRSRLNLGLDAMVVTDGPAA